jgi:hypothetical protein
MDKNELPHDQRHLEVQSGASKMIFEPIVRLAQTMHYLAPELTLLPNGPK